MEFRVACIGMRDTDLGLGLEIRAINFSLGFPFQGGLCGLQGCIKHPCKCTPCAEALLCKVCGIAAWPAAKPTRKCLL